MRLALVSDIHGNWEAFKAVLDDIKKLGLSKTICCGDSVNYCGSPNEVVNYLRENKIVCVQGNHDIHSVDLQEMNKFNSYAQQGLRIMNKVLSKENKEFLSKLPQHYKGEVENRKIVFVHGSINNPWWDYVYSNTNEEILKGFFDKTKAHVIVCGHTHIPFVKRMRDGRLLINCGSVGQPRDNNNKAAYAVLDTHSLSANIRRVEYDINSAARKTISLGLPGYLAERLTQGR